MGADDPITHFGFPPLTTVIGLEGAPPEVTRLLLGRWMADPLRGAAPGAAFVIGWHPTPDPAPAAVASEPTVRWRAEADGGCLWNGCGRVLPSPGAQRSTVELAPGALAKPACFEPLVEAALGDALAARGECFLHAAGIELGERRLLVIGDGGAGKSTLSAAVAAHGGRVISDDSLLLGLAGGLPLVRAGRRNVWLRPGAASLLPALRSRGLTPEPSPNGRIRLDRERCPRAFASSMQPDRLILLARDPGEAGVRSRPLSQAEALAALLRGTSALYLTDGRFGERRRLLLALMTAFAEALPAIELRLGSSLLEATEECLAAVAGSLP